MRLGNSRGSDNVEDRRGMKMPGGGRGFGVGTIVIALVAAYFFGVDPQVILGLVGGGSPSVSGLASAPPADDAAAQFTSKILAETEDTWQTIFKENGRQYQDPKLVLYNDVTETACGTGQAATGPFYCPADQKIYLDLSFFQELRDRFAAPGEFAEAYVIAHEVGHHVQDLLGISQKVQAARQRAGSEAAANALSVRLELQADCYAGLWAKRTDAAKGILEPGEFQQAIAAATAIGDDRLQKQARGVVVPESFTHGTSAQRVRWFERGFENTDPASCDTFKAAHL
ncbi:KPN_02809 family neutral zinc metallopeptidase [Govanella unica]|uniref:Neutral zinc metallopeptidase n=1 Tax=Govanella unica TaxID=2975056 RepID=A0A9X3TWW4_9PROT|nr:neutral zinc metallopeptidase [Govania unica]MDA5193243.1 neutral zinc metallopeptidase [Govania unica]